jgi:hypothetical protein
MAVHAHMRAPWGQVGGHAARPRAEVLEGVLGIDAALNGVALGAVRGGEIPTAHKAALRGGIPTAHKAALKHLCEHFMSGGCCYSIWEFTHPSMKSASSHVLVSVTSR